MAIRQSLLSFFCAEDSVLFPMTTAELLQSRLIENLKKTLSKGAVKLSYPAGCPEIGLFLFDPAVLEGPISHDEAQAVVAEPAYWSFCWASGQVLAKYILAHPELVKGKSIVDMGSGSGIVAIAAAKAGAKQVIACDIDSDALDAVRANAQANNVQLEYREDFFQISEPIDLITAADVLYDRENYDFLNVFTERASGVLLADSRVKVLPVDHYDLQTTIEARTWPDLNEFEEFNQVRIYYAGNVL